MEEQEVVVEHTQVLDAAEPEARRWEQDERYQQYTPEHRAERDLVASLDGYHYWSRTPTGVRLGMHRLGSPSRCKPLSAPRTLPAKKLGRYASTHIVLGRGCYGLQQGHQPRRLARFWGPAPGAGAY